MSVRKIPDSERWKRRRPRRLKARAERAAPARIDQVIGQAFSEQTKAETPSTVVEQPLSEQTQYEQARIAKWIRDRVLVDWRESCWHCRKPIVPGQLWTTVAGDVARARFHQDCHTAWRIEQETLARKALGLDRKEATAP
jgi:hypothetical protein